MLIEIIIFGLIVNILSRLFMNVIIAILLFMRLNKFNDVDTLMITTNLINLERKMVSLRKRCITNKINILKAEDIWFLFPFVGILKIIILIIETLSIDILEYVTDDIEKYTTYYENLLEKHDSKSNKEV